MSTPDRLIQVGVDRLIGGPNVRERIDAGLRRSIAEHGVLQPVTVARRGSRYQVLYGHRRVAAARAAGLRRIPAIVVDQPEDLALRQVIENVDRKPMSTIEIARAMRAHLDAHPGMAMTALARALGRSLPYVSHKLELLELGDDVLGRIERGELGAEAAIKARRRTVHYAAGRPRDIPLPTEQSRSSSVVVPLSRPAGRDAGRVTIGIERDTNHVDLVLEDGATGAMLATLSIAEAKLLGRRLTQAAEALLASSDGPPPATSPMASGRSLSPVLRPD